MRIQFFTRLFPIFPALLAAVVLGFTPLRTVGLVLTAAALAGVVWSGLNTSFTSTMSSQLLITFGVVTGLQPAGGHSTWSIGLTIAGGALMLLIAFQPTVAAVIGKPTIEVANLPTYASGRLPVAPVILYATNVVAIALLAAAMATGVTAWPVAALVVLNIGASGYTALRARLERRRTEGTASAFHSAIEAYGPEFVLYFSAPANTEYHVHMWLPYLERIDRRFTIIVREPKAFKMLAASTPHPVVYCSNVSMVDQAVTASMRACFYVNNGALNAHMVRFNHMTHIQLLHGDSDKASSCNPVTAMYDRIFVAGQAGIDRYEANGVHIPREKFDIVGRPQVETIEVSHDRIGDIGEKVVLYASTWVGLYTDANYCSLPIGETIVRKLLERKATVILRPHPYTHRDVTSATTVARLNDILAEDREKTGRQHIFGTAATTEMSVFDCANKADAMISDVSGVASDFLYSAKPFALANMLGESKASFEASFPLAKAAYIVEAAGANLDAVLDELLEDDSLADTRREIKAYYLGDFDDAPYAEAFVSAARSYVDAGSAMESRVITAGLAGDGAGDMADGMSEARTGV